MVFCLVGLAAASLFFVLSKPKTIFRPIYRIEKSTKYEISHI